MYVHVLNFLLLIRHLYVTPKPSDENVSVALLVTALCTIFPVMFLIPQASKIKTSSIS